MMLIVLFFMMMYRNPAVALMLDITPKPLRAKANSIINIMGYLGGGAATILGVFLKLSDYINVTDRAQKMWIIELPFLLGFIFMKSGAWGALPVYAAILTAHRAIVFSVFVKNIKAKKMENGKCKRD